MKNINIPASILKLFLEESGHFNEGVKKEENEPPELVEKQGSKKVLKDFLDKIIRTYGLEDEGSIFAATLIDACFNRELEWRAVEKIIQCVLDYIDEDMEDDEYEDDED